MASIEEKVEEYFKNELDNIGVRHYAKTEKINKSIDDALKNADSKSGNKGNNYPDIRLLLENNHRRNIPVMIEAKGSKGKLEKFTKDNSIELISSGKNKYSAVMNYAVNGALHYGLAILDEGTYKEVIIIGVNGSKLDEDGNVSDAEIKAYYVSEKNNRIPKEIKNFSCVQMKDENIDDLYVLLDTLNLADEELEKLKRSKEELLEKSIKSIHQRIYDDTSMKNLLGTNDKLYFFCGLIMAGLTTEGVRPLDIDDLPSNNDEENNDGKTIITRTKSFLKKKYCSNEKIDMIVGYLKPVFEKPNLWKPKKGESIIKSVYKQIKNEILPLLESNIHLDFTGKILNSLNDWVAIDNDKKNDVVLTPRFVTNLMARICKTNMNSFLWDTCMGSSGFLVSGMDLMIADAKANIKDKDTLNRKISDIKSKQLLGIEILGNIYILAVLNMILMGDGSSQIICNDSHNEINKIDMGKFPANVFLLNPPYSAEGKGLIFVNEAFSRMANGYGAVLIQENAGSGQGDVYSKRLLQNNTLIASIHMPTKLFIGKSSVQTAIYLFKVNRPHEEDDVVIFIDFSEDGYSRLARKKSTQEVNLRNTDHALERYDEVVAICLGKKPKTDYYTEANGKIIKDTISLNGDDWTFNQHKNIDTMPTVKDFEKTVADYLAYKATPLTKDKSNYQLSPRFLEIEKDFKKKGGTFKSFLVGGNDGLFTITPTSTYKKLVKDEQGRIPVVTNSIFNQGITAYSNQPATENNVITFSDTVSGSAISYFYHDYPFIGFSHVQKMIPNNFVLNKYTAKYFISCLKKASLNQYDYQAKMNRDEVASLKIELPVINNTICFDYMENVIKECENDFIGKLKHDFEIKLNAYLNVIGLNN